ncbi:O-methyltransferase-domain-containing protein [Aspergillus ambiguus]|uniref:O-methyltransferase-domain-containing protein n=1 Tax=Aspergillus ambiguus TaxID=176160 RepID=UPI003CCCFE45
MSSYMDFFNAMGFVSPSDPTNTPYAFARGVKDMDFFTLLQKDQKASKTFNEAMTSLKGHGKIGSSYDFGSLQVTSNDDVVLVDVDIKGKFVLQDLPSVIEAGERVCPPDVEVQPYNFFTQVQPVKGAVAYLYKCILHDWPDAECTTILQNLAPAMRGYNSKLLICDVVISDTRPDAQKVLYDINMIFLAGKERSVKQWERLLRGGGFRIERIVGLENPGTSIIEAVLIE